jgi:hypothetical protein
LSNAIKEVPVGENEEDPMRKLKIITDQMAKVAELEGEI